VIDGDTLLVDGDPRRLRLEGIDAPEMPRDDAPGEPWANEARRFLEQALGTDRQVRLEAGGTPADRYGRPLVFVWRQQDLLNEQLVRAGLARAALGFPFRDDYKQRLAQAQREARAARRGIWSAAPPP
jgi:micrococcal nuclease